MSAPGRRWLLVALLIGFAARLAALPLPGTRDVLDWKATAFVASTDLLGVYGRGGSPPEERRLLWDRAYATTEYPPIDQLEMAIVGRVYRFFDPEFRDSALLSALIKLPGLIAEIVFVVALLTWGRRVLGEPAVWAALAFWLNPAIWLAGAVDGYLDAQMAVPAALAFLAVFDRRPRLAGVLLGIAILTKPQALFIVPILAVMLARRNGRTQLAPLISAALASVGVAVAAFLPYALAGTLPSLLRALQRFGEHDLVSGNATNLWWLLTWAAGSFVRLAELGWAGALSRPATMVRISMAVSQGIPNPRTVGLLLTIASIGWGVWRCRRGVSAPVGALVGAWCVIAYFMLAGQVHENHSYLALPFLAIAAGALPQLRRLYWLISAAFVLNLYLFYGLGETLPPVIARHWTFVDMSVLLSVVYLGLAIWMTAEVRTLTGKRAVSA
jgi:hypothetical protein